MIYLPNFLTILRLLLIPFISYFCIQARYDLALLILLVAGFSDFFDGALARKYQLRTRMGAILDPAADKFLMFFTYITLGYTQQLPLYVVALVVGRDVYIVLGYLFLKTQVNKVEIKPLRSSKINTFCQLALLCFSLFYSYILMHQLSLFDIFELPAFCGKQIFIWGVVAFTFVSGFNYTKVGWNILKSSKDAR